MLIGRLCQSRLALLARESWHGILIRSAQAGGRFRRAPVQEYVLSWANVTGASVALL